MGRARCALFVSFVGSVGSVGGLLVLMLAACSSFSATPDWRQNRLGQYACAGYPAAMAYWR